jgi:hypothetical protein
MLVWRLLRNRLPTRDNLAQHHIIAPESQLCATGCGGVETAHHLFLFCPVFTSHCGAWSEVGLGCPRQIRISFRTTLFSLSIQQGAPELAALSCSSFGFAAFGWCGKNGMTESSRQRNRKYFNWRRKSKFILFSRWKLPTWIYVLILICGGRTLLFVCN